MIDQFLVENFKDYKFQNALQISTSNHMFRRVIRDKFLKITRVIYPQNRPNQTCSYWLITPNQKTLCIETNIF